MNNISTSVKDKLLAYFWISLVLDDSASGRLDTSNINYQICSEDHDAIRFWENTQYLIYQATNYRASLMEVLYNKLKHKRSLHFASTVGTSFDVKRKIINNELHIKIIIPENKIYDDEKLEYANHDNCDLITINNLISNGYDFAETMPANNGLGQTIIEYAKQIAQILRHDIIQLHDEEYTSLYELILISLSYTYPTKLYPTKIFSALLYRYQQDDNTEISNGGLFLIWHPKVQVDNIETYIASSLDFEKLRTKVSQYCGNKITSALLSLARKKIYETKLEATKSAKSAIMSRNMSHNLGSHVMAYLKQKLGSVADILKEENRVLANLEIKHIDQMLETHGIKTSELELPFLVGLGRFIGYLQERQDYIATVATDYIPYGAPVNMKDAIYDELNPDLRYMRHHSNGDKSQNRPANILMNYIAKSEGLSRENLEKRQSGSSPTFNTINDIRFGFVAYCDEKPLFFGINPDNCNSDNEALFIMRKVNFSLPGGLVGRQAVFSIVENIIRNAAKHGNRSAEQNLDLIFDVIDGADVVAKKEEITTQRLSETSQELFCRANRNDVESLYIITLTDNLLITKQKVRDITNKGLAEEYIDDDGKMKTGNKGIKEMRISAAWIRRQTDENKYLKMDDESAPGSKLAPLLLAEWVNPTLGESLLLNNSESDTSRMENEKGHLRYIFCLPKNRFAAVILDEKQDPRMWNKLHKMAPNDWTIYEGEKAIDDFCKNDNKSFDFIIVADDSIRRKILPHASNRVVIWDNNIVLSDKNLENEVKERIYALYTGIRKNDTPIYIWDNKSFESHGKEKIAPGIKLCSSEEYQDDALYAYRTHHSTETDFQAYWKEKQNKYKNLICVDAVTGDNSSDRLVRREVLNTRWYYMHLYAMRKRVAVFDERIFRIIHDVDETAFIKGREDVIEYLEELDNLPEGDLESFKDKVLPIFNFQESVQVIHAETKKEIQELLLRKKVSFIPLDGFSMQTIFQSDRGVDVFTIIREAPFRFSIVGCICCKYKDEAHPYVCTFDKIGTLSIVNSEYKIEFINKEFMNRYDYITIHQGILDKIYEGMDIKHDDKAKTQVTECIYTGFMQNPEKIDFVDNNTECQFLPRFIIHSGRAKPTHEDMPQHQPFIQYAAIENGIKDCKYSLIELLDYARYE